MTGFRNILMGTAGASTAGYQVDNSAMFNDGDSEYFTRTPSSAASTDGNKINTVSFWFKRGTLGIDTRFLNGRNAGGTDAYQLGINASDKFLFHPKIGTSEMSSSISFRDPHSWYHVVCAIDTTQGTESNRYAFWVNGVNRSSTLTGTKPAEDLTMKLNENGVEQLVGAYKDSSPSNYWDGHLAEFVVIDGQKLDASSFGEFDSNGIWRPKNPSSNNFGNNGFYLNFAASGSDLGDDAKGSNDFTNTNSVTQSNDSPTKNYAVWSPLNKHSGVTLSGGNTKVTGGSATQGMVFSTFSVPTGLKVYVEMTCTSSNTTMTGVVKSSSALLTDSSKTFDDQAAKDGRLLHVGSGDVYYDDSITSLTSNYAPDDAVSVTHMIALDLVNDKIYWGDAGVGSSGWANGGGSYNQAFGSATGVDLDADLDWHFAAKPYNGAVELNFGQKAFTVSPPTGYISGLSAALLNENRSTALTIEDGTKYMQTTLYAGNNSSGSSQNIAQGGNSKFQPDFVWIKNRDQNDAHILTDAVRGVTEVMYSDVVDDEDTDADTLTAWRVDGFTVGADDKVNTNTENYVAWQWLGANTTAAPSGSSGISSLSVSANTTSGFSVGTFTGQSSGTGVVAHGLGGEPDWIIVKPRAVNESWLVWHSAIHAKSGNGNRIFLESDAKNYSGGASISAVSSDTFTIPDDSFYHSRTFLFYAWREIPGFSTFGSYSATAGLPLITLDFKPQLAFFKRTDDTGEWFIADTGRDPYDDKETKRLYADTNASENSGTDRIQFGSNFIKVRGAHTSSDPNVGGTYVYSIFGEHPFAGATPAAAL